MNGRDPFERVVASLQEAALDDALWPAAAVLIDEAVGSKGNGLLAPSGAGGEAHFLRCACLYRGERREDLEREYGETYQRLDCRLPRLRRLPEGVLTHVTELLTEEELKSSPGYNEFGPRADGCNSLSVRLRGADGADATWVILDPVTADWQSEQMRMVARLLPQVRHFVNVRRALARADVLDAFHGALLDHGGVGVVFLDRRGRIAEANDPAIDVLRRGDALWSEDGFLRAWLPADDVRLRRLVAACLPSSGAQAGGGSCPVRPGLTLHVHPATARQMDDGATDLGALVLIDAPERRPAADVEEVGPALGLTPGQSRVAVLLAAGKTVPDIAAESGRSAGSIRAHLKRIHQRLGVSRRADLVRMVLSVQGDARLRQGGGDEGRQR